MNWQKVSKQLQAADYPFFVVRRLGISMSAELVRMCDISVGVSRAEIYCDRANNAYGLRFVNIVTPDSYVITSDGGGRKADSSKKTNTAFIACGRIVSTNPALLAEAQSGKKTRLPALFDKDNSIVYFRVGPTFEHKYSERRPQGNERGVYRYMLDGEAVYIGQGALQERLASKERETWKYDDIEYMIVDDEEKRFSVEAGLIDEIRQTTGRLPFYNRVGGRRIE
jgi:hypothetical protein